MDRRLRGDGPDKMLIKGMLIVMLILGVSACLLLKLT